MVWASTVRGSIDFDRALESLAELEIRTQSLHHHADLIGREVRRRPAAEVQLIHLRPPSHERTVQRDLAIEVLQILFGLATIPRHDLVAAAVEANRAAERHVHVQRERSGESAAIATPGPAGMGVRRVAGVKPIRRGIRRVARSVAIEAADEIGVEERMRSPLACLDALMDG